MVVIRLSRGGAKKRPFYHIVVTDKRSPRDGRNIERVGYFNPIAKGREIPLHIKLDRVKHWVAVGAQTSNRVSKLLKKYEKEANDAAKKTVDESQHTESSES